MYAVENAKIKLTYEDYCLIPSEGKIHQIVDGDHLMTPAPGTYHQTLSRRLQFQLYELIERRGMGYVFDAPTDVQLSRTDIVQPDILVILSHRKGCISPTKIIGPPDLVVEIVSETTRKIDESLKLSLYQKAKVPEYWIVDSENLTVRQYLLEGERFMLMAETQSQLTFQGLQDVKVDLTQVW